MQFQTNSSLPVDGFGRNSIRQMKKWKSNRSVKRLSTFKLEFNWQQSNERSHLHFQCELKTTSVILITVLIFLLVIIRRFSFFSTHFSPSFLSFVLSSFFASTSIFNSFHYYPRCRNSIVFAKKTRKKTKRMCVYICQAFTYDQDWFDISTFNTFV